ncbi:hypothetical protein CCR85_11170 [Rhodothalassium salexigens]|uniref:NAD-dependent epimerase/dehydratase family protein n=1 Tax=Rhodothalassium salexigens TaxID=1086 RepID=UPI00191348B7|nr:NAD(P)-dependent oxidoreductase [Rhodothalassium salexigens]MBK5912049.1 hypothetical protein [Rhodothalassium salexigens]MBK5921193.1 hypothetical protein [Rhodothalassium salexigens]
MVAAGPPPPGATVALTGATGFLGGYILERLTQGGYRVRALTRRPQPERPGVTWVPGRMDDDASLRRLVAGAQGLVHNAGLVRAWNRAEFFSVNAWGTLRLAMAVGMAAPEMRRCVLISSLAARSPRLSAYAASKRAAEQIWAGLPATMAPVALRPPAIYGPGDQEVLRLLKAGRSGFLPAPAGRRGRFSLIHARDAAEAIHAALACPSLPEPVYELGDGHDQGYRMADVAAMMRSMVARQPVVVPVPRLLVWALGSANTLFGRIGRRAVFFSAGKAREAIHPDWVSAADRGGPTIPGWTPGVALEAGLKETLTHAGLLSDDPPANT